MLRSKYKFQYSIIIRPVYFAKTIKAIWVFEKYILKFFCACPRKDIQFCADFYFMNPRIFTLTFVLLGPLIKIFTDYFILFAAEI